jgi:hypothetical protein
MGAELEAAEYDPSVTKRLSSTGDWSYSSLPSERGAAG